MRTSVMVFGSKPKKLNSLKPSDKRRISLLNSDFKIATGFEAKRFGSTATHSLTPLLLVMIVAFTMASTWLEMLSSR